MHTNLILFEVRLVIDLETEPPFAVILTIVLNLLSDGDDSAFFIPAALTLPLWLAGEDLIEGSVCICKK